MVWVYLGRLILAVCILLGAGVLFGLAWFITFYFSLGSAPMDSH